MTIQTDATRRQPECKSAFHVERRPHFLLVALRGEASLDQAEVVYAQLLRIPLDGYSLVIFDLAELTSISFLAMGALVVYRRCLQRRGVEVRLANAQARVWSALEKVGLWKLFKPMDLQEPMRPAATAVAPSSPESGPE